VGDLTQNFSYDEVRCPCGCGNAAISKDLMNRLQIIRTALGVPLTVTSGVRCQEYNLSIGGVEDSEHVPIYDLDKITSQPGEGIDIKCQNSTLRWDMMRLGLLLFERVGDGEGFVHFGVRSTKPQRVLWNYYA